MARKYKPPILTAREIATLNRPTKVIGTVKVKAHKRVVRARRPAQQERNKLIDTLGRKFLRSCKAHGVTAADIAHVKSFVNEFNKLRGR